MNLGGIFIDTFFCIIGASFGVALLLAIALARLCKTPPRPYVSLTLVLGLALSIAAIFFLHHPIFVAWHQRQNAFVPQVDCVTYEPTFSRLYAKYRMNRRTFDQWVTDHPWKLKPCDLNFLHHDGPRLGLDSPEAAYATEIAPNGKQLRVYYKDGMMYLSYNAM